MYGKQSPLACCLKVKGKCLWLQFVSNSAAPWTVPARLLCPWNSLDKNTGVGSRSLLWGIFPTQGSNLAFLHYRRILYYLSYQGSPRVPACCLSLLYSKSVSGDLVGKSGLSFLPSPPETSKSLVNFHFGWSRAEPQHGGVMAGARQMWFCDRFWLIGMVMCSVGLLL